MTPKLLPLPQAPNVLTAVSTMHTGSLTLLVQRPWESRGGREDRPERGERLPRASGVVRTGCLHIRYPLPWSFLKLGQPPEIILPALKCPQIRHSLFSAKVDTPC